MNLNKFQENLDKCTSCGFCHSSCPLFLELKHEPVSPRGKLLLIKNALLGQGDPKRLARYLEMCLGCGVCADSCPSGIPTNLVVNKARIELIKKGKSPWQWQLFGKLFEGDSVARSRQVRLFAFLWNAYKRDWFPLPPFVIDEVKRYAPEPPEKNLMSEIPEWNEPAVEARGTVGLFLGCLTDQFFTQTGKRALDALLKLGYRVYVPKDQRCCGAPLSHIGLENEAKNQAAYNLGAFKDVQLDAVVTVCGSCGAALKNLYPFYHPDGKAFSAKVMDFSQIILAELDGPRGKELLSSFAENGQTGETAYYDSCRLRSVMGVYQEPREVITRIGHQLAEFKEGENCCSFAGVFSANHYDLAIRIARGRVAPLKDTAVSRMVVCDPGCRVHLTDAVRRSRMDIEVCHLADLL